jgi:hypothetical protein
MGLDGILDLNFVVVVNLMIHMMEILMSGLVELFLTTKTVDSGYPSSKLDQI